MIRELRESGRRLDVTCFFEELPLPVAGKVVSKESATLEGYNSISIHANHSDMVKFSSADDNGFKHDRDRQCLKDLWATDPEDEKTRIQQTKGDLLKDVYSWILENPELQKWRDDQQNRLLWVRGDPGKGKTMLVCGIVDELKESIGKSKLLSFFFCQATDSRINNATAVLRSLIRQLVDQQPSLISHIRKKYDLYEYTNSWFAVSRIFIDILKDHSLKSTILVIDGLDECQDNLLELLKIVQKWRSYPRVKWLVTSRNWPSSVQERLDTAGQLSLELNAKSVSTAVEIYIKHKVCQLVKLKKYDPNTQKAIQKHLSENANGTFLWVALVSQELAKTSRWNTLSKLNTLPSGLTDLYKRMLEQIFTAEDADLCQRVLAVVLTVYRPITLDELIAFVDMPYGVSNDYEVLSEIIALCGSFLTLRKRTIFFIHQSAKEFLMEMAPTYFFVSGMKDQHLAIFSRSLNVMFATLRRNIYNLSSPGSPLDQVRPLDPDPLAAAQYSCFFWVNHLQESDIKANNDLEEGGSVEKFLFQKFLHWVEAISLLRGISEGIAAMVKLDSFLKKIGKSQAVSKRVLDGYRFIRYHRRAVESSPLQVYNSSLIFSPAQSITSVCYRNERPQWVLVEPAMEDDWNQCLQTLEGHSSWVSSVAWSLDGSRLASGLGDGTVKIWDPAIRQCTLTLEEHSNSVDSIAWSLDGSQLALGSGDSTVKIWDPATRQQCVLTLEVHSNLVSSIAWSLDGNRLTSGSSDRILRIWDLATRQCTLTLKGHSNSVTSIVWSLDGSQLTSGLGDNTVKIWDLGTRECISTLEEHNNSVNSIVWSLDGSRLASGSRNAKVRIWDPANEQCISILDVQSSGRLRFATCLGCVALSADVAVIVATEALPDFAGAIL
ncbi:hypothetical protein BDBG_16392 [Blastomyces gilchristii SLH14081]|uniref:Mitochondrial division protein 1 n=1 Tax=Blastomyces gilchristii (strain SLH14081) TaxID=559298 RepID=A0A179UEU7_BLAGS|nr:uncharacterized protein BDBG_16392 [Blastomyces gilchristii SLH14081]OAT05042.1 hypothetical protein BDBG_16392 [Blastomyces gilchristii SLH14081]